MAKSIVILMLFFLATKTSFADVNYYQAKTAERNAETAKADREARLARAKTLSEMSQKSYVRQPAANSPQRRSLRTRSSNQQTKSFKHRVHPNVMEKIKSRRGYK